MKQKYLWLTVACIFVWSSIAPYDYFTWILEVGPVIIGAILLWQTRRTFPITPLLATLIALHMVILLVGGHYTYAEVPLFNWIQEAFGLSRNHYDRVGHFMQGFVPAILAREILLRRSPLNDGKWLFFIVTSIALGFSAFYELIEWWVAAATGSAADAFLGSQGDVWDTQWDMMLALIGAILAQCLLRKIHQAQLSLLLKT